MVDCYRHYAANKISLIVDYGLVRIANHGLTPTAMRFHRYAIQDSREAATAYSCGRQPADKSVPTRSREAAAATTMSHASKAMNALRLGPDEMRHLFMRHMAHFAAKCH